MRGEMAGPGLYGPWYPGPQGEEGGGGWLRLETKGHQHCLYAKLKVKGTTLGPLTLTAWDLAAVVSKMNPCWVPPRVTGLIARLRKPRVDPGIGVGEGRPQGNSTGSESAPRTSAAGGGCWFPWLCCVSIPPLTEIHCSVSGLRLPAGGSCLFPPCSCLFPSCTCLFPTCSCLFPSWSLPLPTMACHDPFYHSPLTIGGFGVSQHSRWLSNIFTIFLTALRLLAPLKEEDSCSWKMNSDPGIVPSRLDTGTWQGRSSGNLGQKPQRTCSVGFAACWCLEAAIPEEKECLGPKLGSCGTTTVSDFHQSCILKHDHSSPALQLFKGPWLHPSRSSGCVKEHITIPLSHPTTHCPPCSNHPESSS